MADLQPVPEAEPESEQQLEINTDDFTGAELVAMEEATGKVMGQLFPDGQPSAAGLYAAYWVARRRNEPDFTYAQALETKLTTLMAAQAKT